MKNANDRLREMRQNLGYSQEAMASCLNMSQANYNRIENSKQPISMEHIPNIAKVAGKKTEEIIQTLNGTTIQNTIHQPQNNQNVVNVTSEEWITKLLEEKDKRLEEKTEIIETKSAAIMEKDLTIAQLHQIIRELTMQLKHKNANHA